MLLYKGVHSVCPEDKTALWLVRRELLLMSREEFKVIKKNYMLREHEPYEYHGLLEKVSEVN